MLIMLPPSEGKTAPRRGGSLQPAKLSFPALNEPRSEVLDALVDLCSTDPDLPLGSEAARHVAGQTLGLGPTQAHEIERNAALRTAPTARADRVYSGVLYDALDLATLQGASKRRATQWIAITSALFGLLRPSDPIPAYRLSGSVALPRIGLVSTYWRRHLEATVLEAAGEGLVVDLRSSAYLPFWRPGRSVAPRVVSVRVLHGRDGARSVVSHFNKATKGRLVRALVEDGGVARSPWAFADQLRDLGWKVEDGARPNQLDVVVDEL